MIKGLVNWIYTERLIASYSLEKNKRQARRGALNPAWKGACATSGSIKLKAKASHK